MSQVLIKRLAIGLVATLVAAVAVSFSLSLALTSRNPTVAVALAPYNALARERLAEARIGAKPTRLQSERAAIDAREAMDRSPYLVRAARTLGVAAAAQRNEAAADAWLVYARHLSRRDARTNLYMIERAVQLNRVGEALTNYDVALRASPDLAETLYPILASALADVSFVPDFQRLARSNPPWFSAFADTASAREGTRENLLKVLLAAPRSDAARDPGVRQLLVRRLAEAGQVHEALRYYRLVRPQEAKALIRQPDFASTPLFVPFEWQLVEDEDVGAMRTPAGLDFRVGPDGAGEVASQLLALAPGAYRIRVTGEIQSEPGRGLASWRFRCEGAGEDLARLDLPTRPGRFTVQEVVRVPAGCAGPWLRLRLTGGNEENEVAGTIARVDLAAVTSVRPMSKQAGIN